MISRNDSDCKVSSKDFLPDTHHYFLSFFLLFHLPASCSLLYFTLSQPEAQKRFFKSLFPSTSLPYTHPPLTISSASPVPSPNSPHPSTFPITHINSKIPPPFSHSAPKIFRSQKHSNPEQIHKIFQIFKNSKISNSLPPKVITLTCLNFSVQSERDCEHRCKCGGCQYWIGFLT